MADTKERLRRDVAQVNQFASDNMHKMNCTDYVAIKQVCAALSDVLNATATPPADAALAEMLEHMEHGAKLIDAIGAICRDGTPEREASAAIRKSAAALRARAVPAVPVVEFSAWLSAVRGYRKAVNDYNAHLDYVRKNCPFGTSVDDQFQAMETARRVALDAMDALADAAMLAASKEPAP